MSIPGSSITLGMAVSIVLVVGGTAGATVLYQGSVQGVHDQNGDLRAENAELRERLNETKANLTEARNRIEELEEKLSTREQDVEKVARELEQTKEQLNRTESRLVELCRDLDKTEDCFNRTEPRNG